ncbi:MAG: HAD-IA family hydrolase [Spirochaetaceae bacterium]|nr:HAD-IA family hydrolase [Spirochaetaceae bacterium]
MKNRFEIVLFDLDGTLLNSLADLAASVNYSLSVNGFEGISAETVRGFLGNGMLHLVECALRETCRQHNSNFSNEDFSAVLETYRSYYLQHCADETCLVPHGMETLEALKKRGLKMAVVSNKPGEQSRKILSKLGVADFFDCVISPEVVAEKKPNPEGIFMAIDEIGKKYGKKFLPENSLMVGDAFQDVLAGHNAGGKVCAFMGGYGDKTMLLDANPDYKIDDFAELVALMDLS